MPHVKRDRDRWMTVGEVAAMTGLGDDVIRRACRDGLLPFTRIPPETGARWIDRGAAVAFQEAFLPKGLDQKIAPNE
jgi:excisionase family DNA binding protein